MNKYGNFDLVTDLDLDFADTHLLQWRSRASGLTVVHLDCDTPIVHAYFGVRSEIFNDSGCPHTLEHLVFMGSEKYPYKGILDQLAARGFSGGTNAWTATDCTVYTVSTAGGQGFLQLLPIYMDHILYPTLTKASYVTEVHHVTGSGEDSGVVYNEMQGRQNTSGDLLAHKMQRLVHPPGSAYRSETGGLMEALRNLSVEQIREYHSEYYVPHNLSLVVSGKLPSGTLSLLEVLQNEVEPTIARHGQNRGPRPPGWKRPFVETPSAERFPFAETTTHTIKFPEKDMSVGELLINFMGPPSDAFLERAGLGFIGAYLTASDIAPLNKEFVEIKKPMCTSIYFDQEVLATRINLAVHASSVPTKHLDLFHEKLLASFKRFVNEGIDMKRMAVLIDQTERMMRSRLESSKGDRFAALVGNEFLYGSEDGSGLVVALDPNSRLKVLRGWTNETWIALFNKYYVDAPCIVLRGKPSAAMVRRLEKEEKARIAARKKDVGPIGLTKFAKELEEAKKEHEREIPTKILTDFPIPDIKSASIGWIPVQSLQQPGKGPGRTPLKQSGNEELARHVESDGSPLSFFVEYDHVKSDFVSIYAYFSLAELPNRLRPYISILESALFSLPVRRSNGEHLSHEEVVKQLDAITVTYGATCGLSGSFTEALQVMIKVEVDKYESAIAWVKDVVYGSQFVKDRLQVIIAKEQQYLPEIKRDGDVVLFSVMEDLLYSEESTSRAGGVLSQAVFLPKLAKRLRQNPKEVINDFEEIRKLITDPSGVRFSVIGNILALKQPRSTWAKYFDDRLPETALKPLRLTHDTLSELGKNPSQKAVVVALPTVESSVVTHWCKGISGFSHPDYPALHLAEGILNAAEGYLWKYIRGSGLAYGASVSVDLETALLSFELHRSSDSMQAFNQAKTVVEDLVSGKIKLEDTTLDAAKSGLVYRITSSVSTPSSAALQSFAFQALEGLPQNFHLELLERSMAVTKQEVIQAMRKYFLPLFNPKSSVAVVVTSPAKAPEVTKGLTQVGFMVEQRKMEDGVVSVYHRLNAWTKLAYLTIHR